jgi:hypothetical protein
LSPSKDPRTSMEPGLTVTSPRVPEPPPSSPRVLVGPLKDTTHHQPGAGILTVAQQAIRKYFKTNHRPSPQLPLPANHHQAHSLLLLPWRYLEAAIIPSFLFLHNNHTLSKYSFLCSLETSVYPGINPSPICMSAKETESRHVQQNKSPPAHLPFHLCLHSQATPLSPSSGPATLPRSS